MNAGPSVCVVGLCIRVVYPIPTHPSTPHAHAHSRFSARHSNDRHLMATINTISPLAMRADAKAISAGWWHTMVLKHTGVVWAAGDNYYGQLGNVTSADSLNFVKVVSSGQCGRTLRHCMRRHTLHLYKHPYQHIFTRAPSISLSHTCTH